MRVHTIESSAQEQSILIAKSQKTNPPTNKKRDASRKRADESPLSDNYSKSVKYRRRVQEELEANEEIRTYKLEDEDFDRPD